MTKQENWYMKHRADLDAVLRAYSDGAQQRLMWEVENVTPLKPEVRERMKDRITNERKAVRRVLRRMGIEEHGREFLGVMCNSYFDDACSFDIAVADASISYPEAYRLRKRCYRLLAEELGLYPLRESRFR